MITFIVTHQRALEWAGKRRTCGPAMKGKLPTALRRDFLLSYIPYTLKKQFCFATDTF